MIHLRPAARADVAAIMHMTRALMAEDRAADLPLCTEQDWLRDVFGETPCLSVLVAECDDAVVGLAIYNHRRIAGFVDPSLYLQDIYVDERYRRRGIATRLLRHIAGAAVSDGIMLIELNVRADNPAREFYRRAGFVCAAQCLTYVIGGPSLISLAELAGNLTGLF